MQRAISLFGALALLTTASTASGAVTDVTGTVTHIHPASNIVEFSDGRQIYLEPGTTFMVDGRQVSIDQIKPGMRVSINGGREATAQEAAIARVPGHPPVDAAGTVVGFDARSNVVTFEDGRMLKLGSSSSVWTQGNVFSIQPGARVLVRDGQPAGYQTAWDAVSMPRHRMGTVIDIDPASALVILSDGTIVRVTQATRVQAEGRTVRVADLRAGDEVVIVGRPTIASEGGMASPGAPAGTRSASGSRAVRTQTLLPYFNATFEASDIHLIRRKQAP